MIIMMTDRRTDREEGGGGVGVGVGGALVYTKAHELDNSFLMVTGKFSVMIGTLLRVFGSSSSSSSLSSTYARWRCLLP